MSELTIVPLGAGRYAVDAGARRRVAYGIRRGPESWVFLDGRTYEITEERRGARSSADVSLAAPMPATVVAIMVAVGHQVAAGDVLVMLEAMKMELAIKAPRGGTVTAIGCRVGELVQPGVALVELV